MFDSVAFAGYPVFFLDWRVMVYIYLGEFLLISHALHEYIFSESSFHFELFQSMTNRYEYKYMQKTQEEKKKHIIYTPRQGGLDWSSH